MYKPDLALNNQQWLICHKTKPLIVMNGYSTLTKSPELKRHYQIQCHTSDTVAYLFFEGVLLLYRGYSKSTSRPIDMAGKNLVFNKQKF